MIGKETKSNGSIALHSVYNILESRRKQKEPIYEQQIALEHAEKFKMSDKDFEKARKALAALGFLKDETVTKVMDIMPKTEALLRQILASERKGFSGEEVQKVLSIVKEAT